MRLNPKWIIGKRITEVRLRSFQDDDGKTIHNPVIWFEDGSHITFTVQEIADASDYGVAINYWKRNQ